MSPEATPVTLSDSQLRHLLSHADTLSGSARQSHGFIFQSAAANLMDLHVPQGYTHKWDAYGDDHTPYSFKNVRASSNVELGSLQRQATIATDFHLCVAFWEKRKLNIKNVHLMHVKEEYWRSLWPEDISTFLKGSVFDGISNSRADDARWSARRMELSEAWKHALPPGSPMKWHAKRDHGNQRRIQCSIGNDGFSQFFSDTFDESSTMLVRELLERENSPSLTAPRPTRPSHA